MIKPKQEEYCRVNFESPESLFSIIEIEDESKISIKINETVKNINVANEFIREYSLEKLQKENKYFEGFTEINKVCKILKGIFSRKQFEIKKKDKNVILIFTIADEFGEKHEISFDLPKIEESKINENEAKLEISTENNSKIPEINFKSNEVDKKNQTIFNETKLKINLKIDEINTIINTKYNDPSTKKDDILFKLNEINTLNNDFNDYIQSIICSINQQENNYFNHDPSLLNTYLTVNNNAITSWSLPNLFTVFKNRNNLDIIAYITKDYSVSFYDINSNNIILTIKQLHNDEIDFIKYYFDKMRKQELLLTGSSDSLKVWDMNNNYRCLLTIEEDKSLYTSEIIFKDNNRYIASIPFGERIKIYDFDKNIYKDFGRNSQREYCFSFIYYSNNKIYIITTHNTSNNGNSTSFDFDTGDIYNIYQGYQKSTSHGAMVLKKNIEILIVSYWNGIVQLFNFNTGSLISTISGNDYRSYGLCIWNDKFLITGGKEGFINIFDYENNTYLKSIKGHDEKVGSIQKYKTTKDDEFFITYSSDGSIKIWK